LRRLQISIVTETHEPNDLREFHAAWWLPGAHLQTIWGRFFRPVSMPPLRHERWDTPDGDIVDIYRVHAPPGAPQFLLLHGLEGGLRSHYARGMLAAAAKRGWGATLLVFRSCGPEPNRLQRLYHSGDTGDARMVLEHLVEAHPDVPLLLAGVSLGGNVLLRLLAEYGGRNSVAGHVAGAATLSVPYDLARSAEFLGHGFSRVYELRFVSSLKRKALAKRARFAGFPADETRIRCARSFYEFDDAVTAPLHGYAGADDYYARASSLPVLGRIRIPTLLISAEDDPFLPREVLHEVRRAARANRALHPLFVPHGGHAGFVTGAPWGPRYWAEDRALAFLAARAREWNAERSAQFALFTGGAA
jgi:predicted alpha/beta-fold hydrolase